MRQYATILSLTIAVLFGSVGLSAGADFQKGLDAYRSGDFAAALREWIPLAEKGDAAAEGKMGLMYRHGLGVPKNNKISMKWYKLAAEQGHSDAKLIIAADNGDKNAAYKLGGIYIGALGGGDFPTDRVMARKYWKIAAEQGHLGAQKMMNISVPWWKPWMLYGWWRFW
mgnify:FL=1